MRHPKNSTKTAKRKRQEVMFCYHFAHTRNGAQSVIKARIPTDHPRQMASELLRQPHIQDEVTKQYAKLIAGDVAARAQAEQEREDKEAARIAAFIALDNIQQTAVIRQEWEALDASGNRPARYPNVIRDYIADGCRIK